MIKILLSYFLLTQYFGSGLETASPIDDFIAAPSNVTVLEGHPALLKCKIRDVVHTCQWFYLKDGLDIMDSKNHPILIKEFRPARDRDCSIRFSKSQIIQTGQWLCKGLQITKRKYIMSKPAFMRVLAEKDAGTLGNRTSTQDTPDQDASGTPFSSEGHILNAEIGEPVLLACHLQTGDAECTWTTPDNKIIRKTNETEISTTLEEEENYQVKGTSIDGNCSIFIKELEESDEGNWQCSVNRSGEIIEGPIVHLHIEGFHRHIPGDEELEGTPLTAILVVVSIVLVVIIIILIVVMYKRVWNRKSHKQLDNSKESTEGGTINKDGEQCLIYDAKGNLSEFGNVSLRSEGANQYTGYLDMTGNPNGDGYVMFPGSAINTDRSSFISRTTTSTLAPGSESGRDSIQSHPTSFAPGWKPPLDRNVSVTSSEHLYEEIPEKFKKFQYEEVDEQPEYANVEEDKEGYMIPTKRTDSPKKENSPNPKEGGAPPYSVVSTSTVLNLPPEDWTPVKENKNTQPTPSPSNGGLEPEENYDVPKSSPVLPHSTNGVNNLEPPVPIRTDSANDPLSYYDVPSGPPVKSRPSTPKL